MYQDYRPPADRVGEQCESKKSIFTYPNLNVYQNKQMVVK